MPGPALLPFCFRITHLSFGASRVFDNALSIFLRPSFSSTFHDTRISALPRIKYAVVEPHEEKPAAEKNYKHEEKVDPTAGHQFFQRVVIRTRRKRHGKQTCDERAWDTGLTAF